MVSKLHIVEKALNICGVSTPFNRASLDDLQDGVSALENMIAAMAGEQIPLNYNYDSSDRKFLNAESGLPNWANEPIIYNLAIRLSFTYGKQLDPQIKIIANKGMQTLRNKTMTIGQLQIHSLTNAGAGYKVSEQSDSQFSNLLQNESGFRDGNGQEIEGL